MDDVVGTIEQQIRADRRALDHNIQALEARAHDAMDLRRHYRDHAATLMAVAFGSGVLLGALSRGSRGPAKLHGSVLSAVDPSGRARYLTSASSSTTSSMPVSESPAPLLWK